MSIAAPQVDDWFIYSPADFYFTGNHKLDVTFRNGEVHYGVIACDVVFRNEQKRKQLDVIFYREHDGKVVAPPIIVGTMGMDAKDRADFVHAREKIEMRTPDEVAALRRRAEAQRAGEMDFPRAMGAYEVSQRVQEMLEAVGVKDDQGKPRMDLLDPEALTELGKVLTFGAKKYAAHNWRKGLSVCRLAAAAMRHLLCILKGEDVDEESGLPHAAHLMCNSMFLIWMMRHKPEMDDRFKAV